MDLQFFSSDCVVTGWSPWTPCSKRCNRGRKFRVRKIIKSERNDGASCPTKLKERRKCIPVKCTGKKQFCSNLISVFYTFICYAGLDLDLFKK